MSVDMQKGAELVPAEDKPVVLADTPHERKTLHARLAGERRPVIAPWLRDQAERRQVALLVAQTVASVVGYHAVRLPWYAVKSVTYSPRGAWRLGRRGADALFDAEGRPLRSHAIARQDIPEYLKLVGERRKRVKARTPAAVGVLLGALTLALLVWLGPWYLAWPIAAVALGVLGRVGQPADRPIVMRAVVPDQTVRKPESEEIVKALIACRIAGMGPKEAAQISFAHPIRVDGPGWRADIDLPAGVTAGDVIDKRAEFSSGARRPVGAVWPEGDKDVHEARLVLWVGMRDMAKSKPAVYPLLKSGTTDFFQGIPFGVDQRGRPISLTLFETNLLIGALPGAGKTAAVRGALCGAALDPTVELHIFEHKGSGDLEAFERIAHSYGSGVDDETIAAAAATIAWLVEEVGRRAGKVKELRQRSRQLVPDSRTTRELANRRGLGLHPIVCVVDECQELFSHPKYGKQAGEDAEKVIRRGRAFGVHLMLATQRPDKDSLPTGVSANVGTRFCMRVKGQVENDMILGTSAYKNGIRATMLRPSDRGIGYLDGSLDHPVIVRTYYLDAEDAERVVHRAHEAREAAGLLTGQAAGEPVEHGQVVDFLDDVRTVMGRIERLWSEDLLERLAELRPQLYGQWTPQQLAAAFKPHAITPGDQKIDGVNRNGYRLSWVLDAMANRELAR